ncbi:MAG: ATP-dependent zinc metalloprotease FtsH [Planctomycetota bacterium]|nr:ATP-dependent zinc metalloprotease FtsH [Planctomycetota bacterium]
MPTLVSRLSSPFTRIARFVGALRLAHQEVDGPRNGKPENGAPRKPGTQPTPPSRGLFTVVVLIALGLMIFLLITSQVQGRNVTLGEFEELYRAGKIDPATVLVFDESVQAVQLPDAVNVGGRVQILLNAATREGVAGEIRRITDGRFQSRPQSALIQMLIFFGPFVLLLVVGWYIISRGLRNAGAGGGMLGNFGKSRHRTLSKEMTGITFSDVAGIDEAKEEVTEIIEFLKNPKKFTKLGGRIPRGVLLVGEPGCGKTLLAKAIAGEADVPFFSISGSDFVEMFVGVGASRVRDLFKQAKESAPCIIFLDEIDAVGRRRGGGFTTGGHDEREQTLNAILVEMDGFATGDGVIVIAATNRNDVLDPALVRPGRFDRQITVPLPDVKGRLEILKVHSKKVRLGPNVDLERIARGTPMFSGADLAAIINEGAIAATMQNKDFIEHEDLEEARDKVKFGRAKKSRVREKDENKLVAYHEAGHAVLQALLTDADPLHKVTIIPRGGAGGATFSLPEKDRMGYGLKWLKATMRVLCGGRIAEARAMGDMSSGAAMDISMVTRFARTMVVEWGMSERLGFVRYAGEDTRESFMPDRDYSDETATLIDEEVRRLVDEAFADAQRLLEQHWDKVEAVANALLKFETLSGDEVHRLMQGGDLNRPSVSDLLKAEARRRSEALVQPQRSAGDSPELPPGAMPTPA